MQLTSLLTHPYTDERRNTQLYGPMADRMLEVFTKIRSWSIHQILEADQLLVALTTLGYCLTLHGQQCPEKSLMQHLVQNGFQFETLIETLQQEKAKQVSYFNDYPTPATIRTQWPSQWYLASLIPLVCTGVVPPHPERFWSVLHHYDTANTTSLRKDFLQQTLSLYPEASLRALQAALVNIDTCKQVTLFPLSWGGILTDSLANQQLAWASLLQSYAQETGGWLQHQLHQFHPDIHALMNVHIALNGCAEKPLDSFSAFMGLIQKENADISIALPALDAHSHF